MRRQLGAMVSVVVVAAILGGCGSSNGGSSGGTKRSIEAFTACLKQHGVDVPRGEGPPHAGGQPPEMSSEMLKAFAACADLAPQRGQNGGGFGTPPGGGGGFQGGS